MFVTTNSSFPRASGMGSIASKKRGASSRRHAKTFWNKSILIILLWRAREQALTKEPPPVPRVLAEDMLNRSTGDSYTQCHGHADIACLRVLPVYQWCGACFRNRWLSP